jgi:SsrA-binding protein
MNISNKKKHELNISNKKAYFLYSIDFEVECGIVLVGSEVKSIRAGNVTIADSFIYIKDNEVWIKNLNVARYKQSHPLDKFEENRDKKLLLNRKEIDKIGKMLLVKGTTAVALSLYVSNNRIKVKIGVGTGKKSFDKKNTIKERDMDREMRRGLV